MSLKTKQLFKRICGIMYYAGVGDFWWQNVYLKTFSYKAYMFISFSVYTTMIFLENLAALYGKFPDVEKNSAVMFSAIHDIVLMKMFLFIYHSKSIRKLIHDMGNVGEDMEKEDVMVKQYRRVKVGITLYAISVYLSLISYGVESARKCLVEKAPFYTVVTYLPHYDDGSITAAIFRVFFYATWLYMMLPMMSADCMPITHVIVLSYKFETLCEHFKSIREEFDKDVMIMDRKAATAILKAGFLEGVRIHQNLLRLCKEVHRVFGVIMSLQVCESSAVAVLLLLRMAVSSFGLLVTVLAKGILMAPKLNLTNAFMTYTFVASLFLLLALNLWNAGEITYQASLLSGCMFGCGWHASPLSAPAHRDVRQDVLIASAQAQKPLVLKAFGVTDLSYSTFVSVARMTYSIFAVFYKRDV